MADPRNARLPAHWSGWWIADDGKAVLLEGSSAPLTPTRWCVAVAPQRHAEPYLSAQPLEGKPFPIADREARCLRGERGRYLEIEAGTSGVGPTYRLYPSVIGADGTPREAGDDDALGRIVLRPETSVGLYDEWEDDLGVPWAEPLRWLRRATE